MKENVTVGGVDAALLAVAPRGFEAAGERKCMVWNNNLSASGPPLITLPYLTLLYLTAL